MIKEKLEENTICYECDEKIEPHHASCIYDGELCHINCAADRMDEAQWDSDMGCG